MKTLKAGPGDNLPTSIGLIEHETLQERVYQSLRDAFLESRFVPGQTLTMRGLAEVTGTSIQPVREALQRLCAEGALEWLPNKAFRVPEIDKRRYSELWDIRRLLEGQAIRLASTKMKKSEVAELRALNREIRALKDKSAPIEMLRLNRNFHFTVYNASDSPILVGLIEMIWLQVSPLFAAFTQSELGAGGVVPKRPPGSSFNRFLILHENVIAALDERRTDDAEVALSELLDLSKRLFLG